MAKAKTSATAPADGEQDNTGLIEVTKGGETLFVHPSALAEHLTLGWTAV